ncbi:hypothetical protein D3C77_591980 [compost metagenome]
MAMKPRRAFSKSCLSLNGNAASTAWLADLVASLAGLAGVGVAWATAVASRAATSPAEDRHFRERCISRILIVV